MKTVAENYPEDFPRSDFSFSGTSHDLPLARLGEDLRGLYDEIIQADQPSTLVDLAGRVDDLIGQGSSDTA